MARVLFAGLLALRAVAELPPAGPYQAAQVTVTDEGLEPGSGQRTRDYQITYPQGAAAGQRFPLIVYAHGFLDGGTLEKWTYGRHFLDLASYGFVVAAPLSCALGCGVHLREGPLAGAGAGLPCPKFPWWPSFVHENARAIDYARNQTGLADWASLIDWAAGVGVAAHSMGGEAVVQLTSSGLAEKYDVKALVCEHCLACINTGAVLTRPAMFMTGTDDVIVFPSWVQDAYNADTAAPKSFRNEVGRGHLEMLQLPGTYNPAVARHAAAFFEVWLKGDRGAYYDITYGNGTDSFCGYADMRDCEHVASSAALLV